MPPSNTRLKIGNACSMSYEVVFSDSFQTSVKQLKKRYARVADDLKRAVHALQADPTIGNLIPDDYGARKLRLPNSSAQRGKSGGFRLIYYVQDDQRRALWLLLLYSKSDQENVSPSELRQLMGQLNE